MMFTALGGVLSSLFRAMLMPLDTCKTGELLFKYCQKLKGILSVFLFYSWLLTLTLGTYITFTYNCSNIVYKRCIPYNSKQKLLLFIFVFVQCCKLMGLLAFRGWWKKFLRGTCQCCTKELLPPLQPLSLVIIRGQLNKYSILSNLSLINTINLFACTGTQCITTFSGSSPRPPHYKWR